MPEDRQGRCYELAFHFIKREEEGLLVHGRVFSGPTPRWVNHAWVETETGFVYEPVYHRFYRKDDFFKAFHAKEDARYSWTDAAALALKHKHFGPWQPQPDGDGEDKGKKRAAPMTATEGDIQTATHQIGSVPMTMGQPDEMYSWQYLLANPYGAMMWDIVLINGHKYVAFLAREPQEEVARMKEPIDVHWKGLSIGIEFKDGRRVLPLIILANVLPLGSVYEVWFNFYGEGQVETQEAIHMLSHQSHLFLFFLDRSPEPVRKIVFPNSVDYFFRGHYGMLESMPEWTDGDFNSAKAHLQRKYSVRDLWGMQ